MLPPPEPAADERLSTLPPDGSRAPGTRPREPSVAISRVVGHARLVLDDEHDDEQVVDLRQGQEGRVEEGNDEQTGTADAEREGLDPGDDAGHGRRHYSGARRPFPGFPVRSRPGRAACRPAVLRQPAGRENRAAIEEASPSL